MSRYLPVANPQNRFSSITMEYDDPDVNPGAPLEVYEDHSRSILASNDSPDVGFKWSVNPYRGCFHACAYCLDGATAILMADGTTRALRDLRVGDALFGTAAQGRFRRCVRTAVLAHWETRKRAYRVELADGTELVASGDHRFLTASGWKHVASETGTSLAVGDLLLGPGGFATGSTTDELEGTDLGHEARLGIVAIDDLGRERELFDITTGTGDFIANGVVSHNCYARPTHEYLSLGAGSDFERKIMVKRNAAELLREAFEKKSWKGEHVVFSGITDCYQPLEAKLAITRSCLEVCVEYRNPAGFITKSPIIERDLELLVELTRVASCRVSVSIPFWDPDVARAIEPFVTTPARRMKIVETLAKAGVRVGVSVSPIVPGLNDEDINDVLKAASDAGATHAFYVLLRLPGAVKEVFETSLRKNLPLRADKVLRKLREAHGGKLYDSTFGTRGSGSGVYAETIAALFDRMARRHGLRTDEMDAWTHADTFRRPERPAKNGQTSFGF